MPRLADGQLRSGRLTWCRGGWGVTEVGGAEPPSTEPVLVFGMRRAPLALDVGLDVAATVTRLGAAVIATGAQLGRPLAGFVLRPPLVSRRYWPQTQLFAMAERGKEIRDRGDQQAKAVVSYLVPVVLEAVLNRIDLTQLVLDRVEIERLVDSVDADAIAAKLDLDAIVDRVPIDRVVARVDVDGIVASVDVDPIVARVDVDAIAAKIDLDAIVARLDIVGIAREVIEEIDLPEIIRESSGAMASETVVGVRMRGIEADERISRIVDRVIMRRHGRNALVVEQGSDTDEDH